MGKAFHKAPFHGEEAFPELLGEEISELRKRIRCLRERWSAVSQQAEIPPIDLPFERIPSGTPASDPEIDLPSSVDEVLSLDVFDTCLRRISGAPGSVFRMLETMMSVEGEPVERFSQQRREVEEEVRSSLQQEGRKEDLTLRDIYEGLAARFNWDQGRMQRWEEAECRLEASLLVPVTSVREGARRFADSGGTVIYVSEMYLSAEMLAGFLRRAGFPVREGCVFTSGDGGLSKGSGNLYEFVKERFDGRSIRHIGDNPETDVAIPARRGIDARAFPRREPMYADALSCVLSALSREVSPGAPFWERLGESVLGPLATAWVLQVLRSPELVAADRLFFLTRDGYFPEMVFRRLAPELKVGTAAVTCFASRRLFGLAAMNVVEAEDWDFLLKPAPGLRTADFLDRARIPMEQVADALRREGLDPGDRLCHHRGFIDPRTKDRLYRVFLEGMDAFYELRDGIRERLLCYLADIGMQSGRTAVLDIGWNGSSLAALERLLGERAPAVGFFLGLWRNAPSPRQRARRLSFFEGKADEHLLRGGPGLLEFILGSPLGSVVDIHYTDPSWQPVYQEPDVTGMYEKRAYSGLEQGLTRFLERFLAAHGFLADGDGSAFLRERMERLVFAPDAEERRFLGAASHVEGWGSPYRYRFLPRMEKLGDIDTHRLAYAYSGWKGAWRTLEFS